MTYSILGRMPESDEVGAAVQSKFPGVGSIVLHGRAQSGCIATQAFADPMHGSNGLDLLELGAAADQVLDILLRSDDSRRQRQTAVLARSGPPAVFTGADVRGWDGWAGASMGPDCVAVGNTLANDSVTSAMASSFEKASGDLTERLIEGLRAGRDAGGELRGLQSAAVLVVKAGSGYGGKSGRHVDISVYDHVAPIEELSRCYGMHRLSYFRSDPENLVEIDGPLARELKAILRAAGFDGLGDTPDWQDDAIAAMQRFMGVENYDNRIRSDALIDREVLDDIRRKHGGG